MRKISVVGLGYVGLPLALLAAKKGFDVIGLDLDESKIEAINDHRDPIHDDYVTAHIQGSTLRASTDFSEVASCEIVIICVPTPVIGYMPDLGPLEGAVVAVCDHLAKGSTVIVESTVNPGVCDEVVIPLIEQKTGYKVGEDFHVSHCPERINPGDPDWSVENIPRVVGSSDEKGLRITADFYGAIIGAPIKPMETIREAEACKVVENSFRDINIAFVNELAMSFTKLGINVKNVIEGAATKPFAFMPHFPSVGVGGHCIPVDPYYLIEYARSSGFEHEFLSLARTINNNMPAFTVDRLEDGLREAGSDIKGAKVVLLGLSYKPNVADDRSSPSYIVKSILEERGATVTTYDPYIVAKSDASSLNEAVSDADAILVATAHREFLEHDYSSTPAKVFVDGRNAFDKEKIESSMIYRGVGT